MNKGLWILGVVLVLVGCGSSNKPDTQAPVISLIGGATITHELGTPFVDPGSSVADDRDRSMIASVSGSVDITDPGDYVLTYTAADAAGNEGTASRVVRVVDTTAPDVTAPANIALGASNGVSVAATDEQIQAFLSSVVFTDYDAQPLVTNNAPAVLALGDTVVTFTVTDTAGNVGTASATISVRDAVDPVVTAPASVTVTALNGSGVDATDTDIAAFLAGATFEDSDSATVLETNAPNVFAFGVTTVVFTATDTAGNVGTASATVTVAGEVQAGNVVKGPLYNARVFLDYDSDGVLDANEPAVLTETNGSFSLIETADAPANYALVAAMETDTIDYLSGESYANTGVTFQAVEGSSVITPFTTIYHQSQQYVGTGSGGSSKMGVFKSVAATSFSKSDLAAALGLPASVDISTYNPFADGADPAIALEVEKKAQQVVTAALLVADSVKGSSSGALDASVAIEAAMSSIVKVVIESSEIIKGEPSENVNNISGAFDFSDPLHLAELNEFVEDDLANGDLASELSAIGVTVPAEVLELALEKAAQVVEQVSKAFDDLTVTDFGTVQANGVSLLKQDAAAEILSVATAAAAVVSTGGELTTFDASAYVTLDSQASLNAAITSNVETAIEYTGSLADETAPSITAPANITVAATDAAGVSGTNAEILTFLAAASATDDITNTVIVTNNALAVFPLGATTVTFSASDRAGNAANPVTALVTVTDQTKPTVTLTGESVVEVVAGGTYNEAGASADDNVDAQVEYSVMVLAAAPTITPITIPLDITNGNGPDGTLGTSDDVTVKGHYASGDFTFTRPPLGGEAPFADWCDGASQCTSGNTAAASKPWVGTNLFFRRMPYNSAVAWCESQNGRLPTRAEITEHLLPVGSGGVFQETMVTPDVNNAGWPQQQSKYWTSDAPASNDAKRFTFTPRAFAGTGEAAIPSNHFSNTADVSNPSVAASRVWVMCVGATESDVVPEPVVVNNVDTSIVGTYTVVYTVVDAAGNTSTIERTVTVYPAPIINAPASITLAAADASGLSGTSPAINEFLAGATASDGNTPVTVSNNAPAIFPLGSTEVIFVANDRTGNPASSVVRTITITDQTKPTVTLTGDSVIKIYHGGTYTEPGATASDNVDSAIDVSISGAVDTSAVGSYILAYTAVDAAGNEASVNRTVAVEKAFKLAGNVVTLSDYYPASATTKSTPFTATYTDGALSLDTTAEPINLLNMQNAVNGTSFNSPMLSFALESLPVGSGTDTIEITLLDGSDGARDTGERMVVLPVAVNWTSDGSSALVVMPAQTLAGYYVDMSGTRIDVEIENGLADLISITSAGASTPASLNVKILAAFAKVAAFESVESLLGEGTYTVNVATALPLTFSTGRGIASVNATFAIEDIQEKLGYAVKGPLSKAIVCLDYNDNAVCDADEPLVTTETDGSYALMEGGNAPANYSVIVAMGADTVDSSSGESYANTGVVLKAPSTAKVVTPLTTMFVAASEDLDPGETFTEADFKASLGLSETIDLATFNPFDENADPALALEAEVLAQNVMTAMVTVAEAVKATASSAGVTVSPEEAVAAALKSIATVAVETSKAQKGESSEVSNISGALDFSNTAHLANIQNAVVKDLQSTEAGGLGALIALKSGAAVSDEVVAAANYVLEKTNDSNAAVAAAFNALTVNDLGSNNAAALSRIKEQAASEITDLSAAVVAQVQSVVSSGGTLDLATSIDSAAYVTLNDVSAITLQASLNESQVTLYQSNGTGAQIVDDNANGIADDKELVISSTRVTLTDHYAGALQGVTSAFTFAESQGELSVDLQSAPLNLRNMTNALSGAAHTSPKIHVDVASLPAGSGADTFEFTLIDGADSTLNAGERKLTATVTVNWQSDGATTSLTMPPQAISAKYTLRSGTDIAIEFANYGANDNFVTLASGASSALTFDILKILAKANAKLPGMGVRLFEAGVYNVTIKTSMGLISPTAVPVESLNATVRVFDPFTLSADAITLQDYSPVLGRVETSTLAPTLLGDVLAVNTSAAPLNLKNIQNAMTGGDFQSPVLSFGLANLPMGSGSGTLNIQLLDGVDDVMDAGERKVTMPVVVDWVSDGTTASITLPEQTITATYTLRSGTDITVEVASGDSDMISVTAAGPATPATLNVKMLSAIAKVNALVAAESLLDEGTYNLKMTTTLPVASATGEQISAVMAVVKIADAFKLSSADVVLTDYDPATKTDIVSTLTPTIVDGRLHVDTSSQPLTLLNIENTLSGKDFRSPVLSFGLDYLPAGSGSSIVTVKLLDGSDAIADTGERKVIVPIRIDWVSDGTTATISVPAQTITATYTLRSGTDIVVEVVNGASDMLSLSSAGAATPASIDLKLLAAIAKINTLLPADALLAEGSYHLAVNPGILMRASDGTKVQELSATIAIAGSVPEITPPSDISLEVASSSSTVAVSDSAIQAFLDAASFVDFSPTPAVLTNNAPNAFPIGATTVTFTLTASNGKTSTATATVTLNEAGAPAVTAPSSISVIAANSGGLAATDSMITAFLAGATYTAFDSATLATDAPSTFPIGNTTVAFSVTDSRGKTGVAVSTVTVAKAANPVITAPSAITVKAQESSSGVAQSDSTTAAFLAGWTASASPSTPYPSPTATVTNDAPNAFPFGDTTVTFTATDNGGQTATATAKVTVEWSITIPPAITGQIAGSIESRYDVAGLTFIRPPLGSEAVSNTYGTGAARDEVRVGPNKYFRKMLWQKAVDWCISMNGRLADAVEVNTYILGAGGIAGPNSDGSWDSTLKWPRGNINYWTISPPYGADDTSAKRRAFITNSYVAQGRNYGTNANIRYAPLCVGDN